MKWRQILVKIINNLSIGLYVFATWLVMFILMPIKILVSALLIVRDTIAYPFYLDRSVNTEEAEE